MKGTSQQPAKPLCKTCAKWAKWNMAVKNIIGRWIKFKMDLGDKEQREEFWKGKVPSKAIRV